ncbi:MAG: plasmid pRiA4b ORF-3 family protein [Actinomycetota bacterium]|nr:plasmid pRiA4b ORF-3 family protein [Actinomycetota bacterium]
MTIRVELVSGRGIVLDPGPGRVLLVGPGHDFGDLADAINLHFARWDLSHLHDFRLADQREIGFPDPDSPGTLDQQRISVSSTLAKGDEFVFVFDFGDDWEHHCRVEEVGVDPEELYGEAPALPVPIWGWGSIPDQYGRRSENDTGEDLEA